MKELRSEVATRARRKYVSLPVLGAAFFAGAACLAVPAAPANAQVTSPKKHAHEHDHSEHDEIEQIFVTASPLEHTRDELAAPVHSMDRDDVLRRLGTTIGEAVASQPGVVTSGFAPGASRPIIRGQDAFRVRVLEDGIGAGDVSDLSADHGVPVNPLVAHRIEILRGPATLRYGGGAIGGVVNTITSRVPQRAVEDDYTGAIYGGYSTASSSRDGAVRLDATTSKLTWHMDGYFREAEEYEIPASPGEQVNTFNNAQGGTLGLSYIDDNWRVGFSAGDVDREYGIPAPEDPADPVRIDMRRLRYEFDAAWNPTVAGSGWLRELRIRNVYTDYRHEEIVASEGVAARYDNEEWEGRVEALHEPVGSGLHGALGAHWRYKELAAGGEAEELLFPTETTMFALYAFEELELTERFGLQFAGRVESVRAEGRTAADVNRDLDFLPLSASVSLQAQATPQLAVGLTVSGAQRAPSTLELFAKGPHEATATFERGDDGLDEETSVAVDLTLRGTIGSAISFDVSGFYTHYDDYIFGRLTGRTCGEDGVCIDGAGEELEELVYESVDARFYGAEFAGRAELGAIGTGTFGVDAQLDLVRAELDDGGDLPRIPPVRWGLGAFFESTMFEGRLGFLRNEAQRQLGQGETKTGSFTMLNADLRYSHPVGDSRMLVDWIVSASNLLDEDARNHVSFLKDDVQLPGRDVRFGVEVSF